MADINRIMDKDYEEIDIINGKLQTENKNTDNILTNKTQITKILDSRGDDIYSTESNQLMTAENQRVVGGVLNSASAGAVPDTNFYTVINNAGGSSTVTNGELNIAVTTESGSSSLVYTNSRARCIGGTMNQYRERIRLSNTGVSNNTRRWGLVDTSAFLNGVYFQLSGTTFSIVAKTNGLSDIIINNGSFNGTLSTVTLDTNYHLYTINYVNGIFRLYIDDVLIHTFKESNSIICGTRHLRAFSQNSNTGIGTSCNLYSRFMTITMFGKNKTQPKYYLQEGITTGVLLKIGIGSLHQITLSGVSNLSVVTIYDGLNATGKKIWTSGTMGPQTFPFAVPFNDGILFEDGLYLVISGANCNAQVIYE